MGGGSSSRQSAAFTDESSWRNRFQPSSAPAAATTEARNYKTVTGAEYPIWKNALNNLGAMFKRPSTNNVQERSAFDTIAMATATATGQDVTDYMGAYPEVDMSLEEQNEWEEEEMSTEVDFDTCHIDPGMWPMSSLHNINKQLSIFKNINNQLSLFKSVNNQLSIFKNVNKQLMFLKTCKRKVVILLKCKEQLEYSFYKKSVPLLKF